MNSRILTLEPSANGKPAAGKRKAAKPVRKPITAKLERYKWGLTVALGVFIPLMSVATSKIAGTLASHNFYWLAAFGGLIGVAVLAVSLSHLAWAIRDVTGSSPRASWALAVALDCSLVLCELVHVAAVGAGLEAVCWAVMVVVAGFAWC